MIIYAISKEQLETVAATGILPPVFGYRLTKDPFGQPYIVAPTSTPPGAKFAPNTEYFVESNGNALSDNHLVVYALNDTSESHRRQQRTPDAVPHHGDHRGVRVPPTPPRSPDHGRSGQAYQDPAGGIQADFDAEMEPTYVGGHIYAQLDTATASGSERCRLVHPQPDAVRDDADGRRSPTRAWWRSRTPACCTRTPPWTPTGPGTCCSR